MSLLSGGEGIRSEDCFVFVPCSFPVWDAVLFSYVRKAVNLPRMDRLLASTCPVSHRSALSPHRRIRRCREPTPEWLRMFKLLEPHRNHTCYLMELYGMIISLFRDISTWLQLGENWTATGEDMHHEHLFVCDRSFFGEFLSFISELIWIPQNTIDYKVYTKLDFS